MQQVDSFKQTNAITGARYDYSTTEKRLVYLSLIEVMKLERVDNYTSRGIDYRKSKPLKFVRK